MNKPKLLFIVPAVLIFVLSSFVSCKADVEEPEENTSEAQDSSSENQEPQLPEYYTVTFNSDGGTFVESQNIEPNGKVIEPEPPFRENYTFSYWTFNDRKWYFNSDTVKRDLELKAKWMGNLYTVTLENNGSLKTINVRYGRNISNLETVPASNSTKKFCGYYTEKYGKGIQYIDSEGKGCKEWDITQNTKLYASWEYTISYGGSINISENPNPVLYTGEEDVVLLDLPSSEERRFVGWYSDYKFEGDKVEIIPAGSSGHKSLYARWGYPVTYENTKGLDNPNPVILEETYNYKDIELSDLIPNDDRIFLGWYDKPELGQKIDKIRNTASKTLYARWGYPIIYKNTNGAEGMGSPEYYTEGVNLYYNHGDVHTYEVGGGKYLASKRFAGWYDALENGNRVDNIPVGTTGTVTLYAIWREPNEYTADEWLLIKNKFIALEKIDGNPVVDTVKIIGSITEQQFCELTDNLWGQCVVENFDFSEALGLTKIPYESLCNSSNLIQLHDGLEWHYLKSIILPPSVTEIEEKAFHNREHLLYVGMPSNLKIIGARAFEGCTSLNTLDIPSGVTAIGDYAFEGCSGLTKIDIPSGVESIGNYAFEGCSSLTKIEIPSGVKNIGDYAFEGCTKLTDIEIPSDIESFGMGLLSGCTGLLSFKFQENFTTIPRYIFGGCKNITRIEIPSTVTRICQGAFRGCSGLTSIEIPSSVTNIDSSAFEGCSSLKTTIDIPYGQRLVGAGTFYGCSNLTGITIPSTVESIGSEAFYGCKGLTTINVPSSVTIFYGSAFADCTGVKISFDHTGWEYYIDGEKRYIYFSDPETNYEKIKNLYDQYNAVQFYFAQVY